jgi:hypothetical protein
MSLPTLKINLNRTMAAGRRINDLRAVKVWDMNKVVFQGAGESRNTAWRKDTVLNVGSRVISQLIVGIMRHIYHHAGVGDMVVFEGGEDSADEVGLTIKVIIQPPGLLPSHVTIAGELVTGPGNALVNPIPVILTPAIPKDRRNATDAVKLGTSSGNAPRRLLLPGTKLSIPEPILLLFRMLLPPTLLIPHNLQPITVSRVLWSVSSMWRIYEPMTTCFVDLYPQLEICSGYKSIFRIS